MNDEFERVEKKLRRMIEAMNLDFDEFIEWAKNQGVKK